MPKTFKGRIWPDLRLERDLVRQVYAEEQCRLVKKSAKDDNRVHGEVIILRQYKL